MFLIPVYYLFTNTFYFSYLYGTFTQCYSYNYKHTYAHVTEVFYDNEGRQ